MIRGTATGRWCYRVICFSCWLCVLLCFRFSRPFLFTQLLFVLPGCLFPLLPSGPRPCFQLSFLSVFSFLPGIFGYSALIFSSQIPWCAGLRTFRPCSYCYWPCMELIFLLCLQCVSLCLVVCDHTSSSRARLSRRHRHGHCAVDGHAWKNQKNMNIRRVLLQLVSHLTKTRVISL